MRALLERQPRLTVVLAHMGAPDYVDFLAIAEDFERAHLDTTMAFTDFFEEMAPFPAELKPRLGALGEAGKVLLGSDFPNIPYPYAHQLESLARLDLGDAGCAGSAGPMPSTCSAGSVVEERACEPLETPGMADNHESRPDECQDGSRSRG